MGHRAWLQRAVLRVQGTRRADRAAPRHRSRALTQATVFSMAGLLVGLPLGLAAGRTLWRVTVGIIPLHAGPLLREEQVLAGPGSAFNPPEASTVRPGPVRSSGVPTGERPRRRRPADRVPLPECRLV